MLINLFIFYLKINFKITFKSWRVKLMCFDVEITDTFNRYRYLLWASVLTDPNLKSKVQVQVQADD